MVATTSVVLIGDGHEIVTWDGHDVVICDGHMKSVGFSATRFTPFPEVVWRIDCDDLRVPHEVGGIPVSVSYASFNFQTLVRTSLIRKTLPSSSKYSLTCSPDERRVLGMCFGSCWHPREPRHARKCDEKAP